MVVIDVGFWFLWCVFVCLCACVLVCKFVCVCVVSRGCTISRLLGKIEHYDESYEGYRGSMLVYLLRACAERKQICCLFDCTPHATQDATLDIQASMKHRLAEMTTKVGQLERQVGRCT